MSALQKVLKEVKDRTNYPVGSPEATAFKTARDAITNKKYSGDKKAQRRAKDKEIGVLWEKMLQDRKTVLGDDNGFTKRLYNEIDNLDKSTKDADNKLKALPKLQSFSFYQGKDKAANIQQRKKLEDIMSDNLAQKFTFSSNLLKAYPRQSGGKRKTRRAHKRKSVRRHKSAHKSRKYRKSRKSRKSK